MREVLESPYAGNALRDSCIIDLHDMLFVLKGVLQIRDAALHHGHGHVFQEGDTVAVWGAGPVGQFAIASAFMLGAASVIAIDRLRSALARSVGAITVDYSSYIISHRITLDEAPKMYNVWRDKKDAVTKIVIDPWAEKAA